jgi:hypothetical protein
MIIYLARLAPNARPADAGRDATVPGNSTPDFSEASDRLSIPCFVLHRMGFFLPRALRLER